MYVRKEACGALFSIPTGNKPSCVCINNSNNNHLYVCMYARNFADLLIPEALHEVADIENIFQIIREDWVVCRSPWISI